MGNKYTSLQSKHIFEGRKQVIIPVNEHYRITTDSNQWMIERARSRNGNKEWEPKLFYPTFESALKGLGEMMVRLWHACNALASSTCASEAVGGEI